MKKILLGFIAVAVMIGLFSVLKKQNLPIATKSTSHTTISPTIPALKPTSQLIFIPYWQLGNNEEIQREIEPYDRIVYFGINATYTGVNTEDPGYTSLTSFAPLMAGKKAYITLRMTDMDTITSILSNKKTWRSIYDDTLHNANRFGFEGVLLDLEAVSVFNHDVVQTQITEFTREFARRTHSAHLSFATTLYGDFSYRKRPYDVGAIAQAVDEIMVMGYDLHKKNGEPGPNFPLKGKNKYGYDIETLIQDLGGAKSKTTMLFGMYGYDWIVDEQKRPIKRATALTYAQIKNQYEEGCDKLNCVLRRDPLSTENEVEFVDHEAQYHIVWYEDLTSVEEKKNFLIRQGISSFGLWAYGYF